MGEIVRWRAGGGEVEVSFDDVRRYLVTGGADVTDKEVMMFLELCRFKGMNPWLREAYLIKYRSNDPANQTPAQIVAGKDYFTRKAAENPACRGWSAGIIVERSGGELLEREGTAYLKGKERLVGGFAEVYREGWRPIKISVSLDEYIKIRWDERKQKMIPQSTWATMPATMIRKVALVQALREAFPEVFGGLYAPEEMDVRMHELDDRPVKPEPQSQPAEDCAAPTPEPEPGGEEGEPAAEEGNGQAIVGELIEETFGGIDKTYIPSGEEYSALMAALRAQITAYAEASGKSQKSVLGMIEKLLRSRYKKKQSDLSRAEWDELITIMEEEAKKASCDKGEETAGMELEDV